MSIDGDIPIVGIEGNNQAINYIHTLIDKLKTELNNKPNQYTALTSPQYESWKNKMLIRLGHAQGAIMFAQAWGILSVEQFKLLQNETLGMAVRTKADVDMGNQ